MVRARMVAVRMVRVLNISVEETAGFQVRYPTRIRYRLRRYDERCLEDFRDLAVGKVAIIVLLSWRQDF